MTCFAQFDSSQSIKMGCEGFNPYDEYPQLIGGVDSLQIRLQYPPKALESSIEGTVYVIINIDTLGITSNPVILKSIGPWCDEEAKRLALTSKFTPAIKNGKYVKSRILIPIKFKLPIKD